MGIFSTIKRFKSIVKNIDIRDIFVFGGFGMLGYGLYLKWGQWLAFMVCGIVLSILGLLWPVFLGYISRRGK